MNILQKIKTVLKGEQLKESIDSQPQHIKVFDELGREIFITKEEWRKKVLPNQLEANWNDPDKLYSDIVNALDDGLGADVLFASERLVQIDDNIERGITLRGIVLMKVGRHDEAEKLFRDYCNKYGESGIVNTNLAKIYAARGDMVESEKILRHALEVDPNQDNALGWIMQIENEKSGKAAVIEILEYYASKPNSWKPQLWLGRYALENKDITKAKEYYRHVLAHCDSSYTLMMISGDLGKNGYLDEIIEMIAPRYKPALHGPACGFNLLETFVQKRELVKGFELLHQMRLQNWVPYNGRLLEYSKALDEIQAEQKEYDNVVPESTDGKVAAIVLDKPVWLYGLKDPRWLHQTKNRDAVKVVIFPLTKTSSAGKTITKMQQEDDFGRLSRGVPLFLAERLYFKTDCKPAVFILTFSDKGPALLSREVDWEFLSHQSKISADVYVTGEIDQTQSKYNLKLHLWKAASGEKVASVSDQAEKDQFSQIIGSLLNSFEIELFKMFDIRHEEAKSYYELPSPAVILNYIYGLAQSLTLSLIENNIGRKEDLMGERNIYEWFSSLIIAGNGNVVPKLMLASGLLKGLDLGSEVPKEFETRLHALLRQESLDSEFALLTPCLLKQFGQNDELQAKLATYMNIEREGYREWLQKIVEG